MILLWGLLEDPTFRSVHDWLSRQKQEIVLIDHAAISRTRVRFSACPRASYLVECDGIVCPLDEVSAAYLRPYDARDYDDPSGDPAARMMRLGIVHHLISSWAENSRALVISRPSAEATNHSKLYQAMRIEEAGFLVPESLVTNDPREVSDFQARHGAVIYKSMSSVRSIVKELDRAPFESKGRLGPTLFQRRVRGRDVRVHVVQDQAFACVVRSDGVDYRYAPSKIEPLRIPEPIAARCVALTAQLGLVLSGIDLIVTPDDEWFCLEVNPNPAFSFFDGSAEKVIARAVADALISAAARPD